jgi:hypothetical protein
MSQSGKVQHSIAPGTYVETLTGNTGGPVPPDGSGNINVIGDGTTVNVVGNPGTNTLTISSGGSVAITYDADAGSATPALGVINFLGGTNISSSAIGNTVNYGLTGIVAIANGGTNASSFANTYGVVYFDGTRLVDTTVGTAGQILTSNGAGVAPTFQAAPASGIQTINGDTGSVTGSAVTIDAGNASLNSGSSVSIDAISATELQLNVSDASQNTIIGNSSGNLTLTGIFNTGLGQDVLGALTTGSANIAIGADSLDNETNGVGNVAIGLNSMNQANGSTDNVAVGSHSLETLTTGVFNIAIGSSAGSDLGSSESSNILLNSTGVVGESNTLRIGESSGVGAADLAAAFIYGVNGVTVSNQLMVVLDSVTEQWGTATIPASGIQTLTGDDGLSVTGSNVNILASNAASDCGKTVLFKRIAADTMELNVTDTSGNTIIGLQAGASSALATGNTALGRYALLNATGSNNVVIGDQPALNNTGNQNIYIGAQVVPNITSGGNNIVLGFTAGAGYGSTENSNILIGSEIPGVGGEAHTLRIGNGTGSVGVGQLAAAYIAGINGVTTSNSMMVTIDSTTDQLGVATIPSGILPWNNVTGTSSAMAVNNGYIANNAGLVTLTLPATAAVGSVIEVAGNGAGGWTIAQNSGQTVHFGNVNTTTGAGGSLSSINRYDCLQMVCTVANTDFVIKASMGNITYV